MFLLDNFLRKYFCGRRVDGFNSVSKISVLRYVIFAAKRAVHPLHFQFIKDLIAKNGCYVCPNRLSVPQGKWLLC